MDFQSAMETFAEAWVAANTKTGSLDSITVPQSQALSLTRPKTPTSPMLPDRNTPGNKMPLQHMFNKELTSESIKNNIGKSLPVHCIVETVTSIDEQTDADKSCWRRKSNVETDSYVIIPVNTIVQELVLVALTRLGYPKETAAVARGAVLIRNWRPLSFDTISPGPLVTVGELLGELSTIATLRIQILRARSNLIQDIKDKLLKLLLVQSHHMLVRSGCPLDTLTLTNMCRENSASNFLPQTGEASEEIRQKFESWISSQLSQVTGIPTIRSVSPRKEAEPQNTTTMSSPPNQHPPYQSTNQKTRMRTSFDPELELPKLQKWFLDNQHPSRQQIQQYVKELNNLDSRRGRKPLDINNVVYWFKNARAAQKRAELRGFCAPIINMNGFHGFHGSLRTQAPSLISSDQHSNSDDDLSHTSETEDPQSLDIMDHESPLSLTNHKRDINNVIDGEEERRTSFAEQTGKDEPEPIEIKQEPADCSTKQTEQTNSNDELNETNKEDHVEVEQTDDVDVNDDNNNDVAQDRFTDEEDVTNDVDDDRGSIDLRRKERIEESDYRTSSPSGGALMSRLAPGFPLVPNSMFSHSIMYMSHYMPGLSHLASPREPPMLGLSQDERRKRNRTFIDPVTEVPRLEQWFSLNTHPSHNLILKYTEELNRMPYRQKFPRLEPKNVQFWFKNRRAKCKRLKMSLFETQNSHYQPN